MTDIPHSDDLFLRFFDRWYEDDDRQQKVFKTTRPDLLSNHAYVGSSRESISRLTDQSQAEVMHCIGRMTEAARNDWSCTLGLTGDMDLSWLEAVDEYYNPGRIAELITSSSPEDFSNDYIVTCCEFGALLAYVMKSLQPRLFWNLEWPYWESSLVDPVSGSVIPVFHWAIKKMSDYGWDDGFAEKVEMCLEMLDQKAS